jgi:transcriptional regulator GlxA family with amidase domain
VVVPYIPAFDSEDRALVAWLRDRAGPQTVILTICAGTTLAAETGLMEGARATSHFRFIGGLRARHPGVNWQEGVRYVADDRFITSGALLAGVDAALVAVHRIAGEEALQRAATAIRADARLAADPRALAPSPRNLRTLIVLALLGSAGVLAFGIADRAWRRLRMSRVADAKGKAERTSASGRAVQEA